MSGYLLPFMKSTNFCHIIDIISKKNEPVLLFKTNNVGIETFSVCCCYGQLVSMDMEGNLKKLGHPESFNSLPAKIIKKIIWLVLPDELCLASLHNSEQEKKIGRKKNNE